MKKDFSGKAKIPSLAATVLCLAAFLILNPDKTETVPETNTVETEAVPEDNISETEPMPEDSTAEVQLQYSFRSEELLKSHFEKHGIEMGFEDETTYLEAANQVISNPDSLHKLEAEDGDDVYYLEATNEFVIVSTDGYIRTYFYPSSGINYYNRQ